MKLGQGKIHGLWSDSAQAMPLTSCVILDTLLNLSEPWVPHL